MKDIFINQDSSIGIIGGADGPTAIFLAGKFDSAWNWINVFGIVIVVLHIGGEYGFASVGAFFIYLFGNIVLLLTYWIVWMMYFAKRAKWNSMVLAILPTLIFLLSGIALAYIPLIISAIIFGVAHIYVTWQNVKK